MTRGLVALVTAVWAVGSAPLAAEPRASWSGRLEVSAGPLWVGREGLGSREATLTPNQVGPAPRFTWFRTESDVSRAPGATVRAGWGLGRLVSVEGALEVARARLTTRVVGDVEVPEDVVATARLTEYALSAGAAVDLARFAFRQGRGRVFLSAAVGHLRQLSAERALVATGRVYHVGGGVKYALRLRPTSRLRATGVRVDVAVRFREGGVRVDARRHPAAALAGGLFVRF